MFRFVAFVWNDRDGSARESAHALLQRHSAGSQGWRVPLRGKGVEVRYVKADADACTGYLLTDDGGVVLGNLFARSQEGVSTPAPASLAEADSRAMLDTNGRH